MTEETDAQVEALRKRWNPDGRPEITHECPPQGGQLLPCCKRTPYEIPLYHRLTLDRELVTCPGTWR